MHVHKAEHTFMISLQVNPVPNCSQIVAKLRNTGGLNARKNTLHTDLSLLSVRKKKNQWYAAFFL
jgi:hypothetical protein